MVEKLKQNISSIRAIGLLFGPAFVAAIAYIDPGNFATNLGAGSSYGYLLLWVLIVANLMASLVQYLSAKVGLVTGQSLPEVIRDRLSPKARLLYWAQAELVALATDIAEVLGGAIALNVLFGLPPVLGGAITGMVSLLVLKVQNRHSQQTFERVIISLLLIVPIGFITGLFLRPPDAGHLASGLLPRFEGANSLFLATAIIGATVMPHVVYLHSALTRDRHGKVPKERLQTLLKATRFDVGAAMVLAGGINIVMLVLAASGLHGLRDTASLEVIFHALHNQVGSLVEILVAIGLLVSGLASTSVGCYAGSIIMEGLLHKQIPLLLRRLLTLLPALALLAIGLDPTRILVISQVALSFGIPFAIIPLVLVSSRKSIMGEYRNHRVTTVIAWGVAGVITALNVTLLLNA